MEQKLIISIDAPNEHADAIIESVKCGLQKFPGARLSSSSKDWLAALHEDENLLVAIANQAITDGPDE